MNLEKDTLLRLYETMTKIRKFEEKAAELFADGKIPGFLHLYLGEEGIAAGVCAHLSNKDFITSTHRGHGHVIAKGADVKRMMAELFAKQDGYCKGKGGSMHIADIDRGVLGANGVVGGGQAIATGAGLSCKLRKTGGVAVCFFGDGASSRGTFHEAVNMAACWSLPVVYVIENNGYAISTSAALSVSVKDLSVRSSAYNIPGVTVDGNDVLAVYEAAQKLIDRARKGEGPAILECKTWRRHGHFEGDNAAYVPEDDKKKGMAADPLPRFRSYLTESEKLSLKEIEDVDQKVEAMIADAVVFATNSPEPDPESLLEDLFV